MLYNFLKTAFRQFFKNKGYTAIHLVGLTLGLATSLVIFLLVRYEGSFEQHWEKKEQIYRMGSRFSGVFESVNKGVSGPVAATLKADYPQFSHVAPMHTQSGMVFLPEERDNYFQDQEVTIVDTSFFKIFSDWEWLAGSDLTMHLPNQIILSEEAAKRYFEKVDHSLMGETVVFQDSLSLIVAGILATPTNNTDIDFDGYISYPTIENKVFENIDLEGWGNFSSTNLVFVEIAPGVTNLNIDDALTRLEETRDDLGATDWKTDFELTALVDLHHDQEYGSFDNAAFALSKKSLLSLAAIAIFLLALACFNFINLETAKATLRAKEIGVRKVLGSSRSALILQFLGETALLTSAAALLVIPMLGFVLPFVEDYLPERFLETWLQWDAIIMLAGLVVVVTIASGMYPAWLVTSSAVSDSIRSVGMSGGTKRSSAYIRKSLIAGQFFVTQLLLVAALVVWKQTDYAINKDMGFNQEAIVNFYMPWEGREDQYQEFQQHVAQSADVEQVSRFANLPAHNGWSSTIMEYEKEGERFELNVHRKQGDTTYFDLFGFELLAGRSYLPRDSTEEYVVNEKLAVTMGFEDPRDAVGSLLYQGEDTYPIVGVVKDFHVQNLHKAKPPLILSYRRSGNLGVKIAASRWQDVDDFLAYARPAWERIWPREEFYYGFMDETIAKLYNNEVRTAKLLTGGTAIAVIISFLGLLGLVAFIAYRRTREIGIRKVLGATVGNIVSLLSWDFMKWILVAILPASILGFILMRNWLNDFAYAFEFNGVLILVAALGSLSIAGLAVLVQGLRAAKRDPIDSLKVE